VELAQVGLANLVSTNGEVVPVLLKFPRCSLFIGAKAIVSEIRLEVCGRGSK
jgi:hypothetical protein